MLDSCVLGTTYGSAYGSSVLKVMQNETLPTIDLLVREAIQNSSDASLHQDDDSFGVNFNYSSFCPRKLNSVLEKIGSILDKNYAQEEADFLEIRDYKTSGLTGSTRLKELKNEDHGNYFKLVFDTGKEQTNNDGGKAGGRWGYGKSVYFRAGIGLVIFYSHIKSGDKYESRLIATMVENEESKGSILRQLKNDAIGRGWWGKKLADENDEILPVIDENEIKEILDIFDLPLFGPTETGTSIIIPYINKAKLMQGIFPEHCNIPDDVIAMCSFKDDIVEYTKLAIQKWYAPKIDNKNLKVYSDQKRLIIRVNGAPIRYKDMRPLFRVVQELYTSALSANKGGRQEYISEEFDGIRSIEIPSNKIEGNKAGFVSTIIADNQKLGSSSSIIPPQAYLRIFNGSTNNDPIVMCARAAGMVLDYKVDGEWTKGISRPEDENSYMLSFFVPDCDLQVKRNAWDSQSDKNDFGEYLRRCEKSDHMDWNDDSNRTIVLNIKRQVRSRVNDSYRKQETDDFEGATSRLAGKIGRKLLPQIGYGINRKGGGGSGGNSGSGGSMSNFELKVSAPSYSADKVSMDIKLTFMNTRREAFIGAFIESEIGMMDANAWEKDIKTKYPVVVEHLEVYSTFSKNTQKTLPFDNKCSKDSKSAKNDFSTVELVYTETGNFRGLRVKNEITNAVISGKIVLKILDKKYCFALKEAKE